MNPFELLGAWLGQVIIWALDLIQAVGPVWGTLIAVLGMVLETTLFVGLVVPGDTLVIAAATGVRDPIHFVVLLVAVIAGTLTGQSLGFLLGRYAGPAIQRSRLGRRLGPSWDRAARLVARRGGIAVFVSRFLPVLHALMPVTVGMSPMTYRRFMQWSVPAAILWASAYVTAGTVAAESFRALAERMHIAGYVFAAIVIAFALVTIVGKRLISAATEPGRLGDDARDDDA